MVPANSDPLDHDWDSDSYYRRVHLRLKVLARLVSQHQGRAHTILDVGSGGGTLARLLGIREGYVGLDQYEGALGRAAGLDLRHWTWNDEGCGPLTPGEQFDLVVVSGFLEYIERRSEFLSRVREVLRPGGVLLASMISEDYRPRQRARAQRGEGTHPCWKRIATPAEMNELIAGAGLEPISATPVINVWREWPGAWVACRMRKRVSSFADVRPSAFVDQIIYEARRREA
jgi:SAM-dependent methyltransferase